MRRIIGYLVAALGLGFLVLMFLRLWDLAEVPFQLVVKLFLTIGLFAAGAVLLAAVRWLFFRDWPAKEDVRP